MKTTRTILALAAVALSSSAWGQAPPPGTYQFISGPGVGTPPFTVSGFSTSLGGSIGGIHIPNCSGLHVHGVFNGFADPASGGCGHGIIQLFVPPPPVISGGSMVGGSSSLPGGMPTNVAGQLALTGPPGPAGFPISRAGDAFLLAIAGFGIERGGAAFGGEGGLGLSAASEGVLRLNMRDEDGSVSLSDQVAFSAAYIRASVARNFAQGPIGGEPAEPKVLQATLANPAQRVLSSPAATSWLEEFAILDDRDAEGHRRDADKTKEQADEYRRLADDARRDAERNRQRAEDARREGRDKDAKGWDEEAERDRAEAERRDREAQRLEGWSEEQRQREADARARAEERRAAAEAARERARQAERDRSERARQAAEEKARIAREEREARRAKEQAERDARRQAQEDRERAREREIARQRARAEREHRQWLAEQEAQKNARARGSSSDADLAAAAARKKKKEEEEEKTWADYVIGVFDGKDETPEEKLLQKIKEKLEDKLKEEAMKHSGLEEIKDQLSERIANNIDDLGLDAAAGKLGEGVETLKKIKEIGDWMNSEMDKMAARQQRQANKIDAILDPRNEQVLRGAGSGTIAGKDVIEVYKGAVEILK